MKALIVSQYFWPEYFRINDLADELQKKGYKVDILTGKPNYPRGEIYDDFKNNPLIFDSFKGCKVYRVPIIARKSGSNFNIVINYTSFLLSGLFVGSYKVRKEKYDVIFTYATSPILVALVSIFLCKIKKAKHVIWVQDLWPDVLSDLNLLNKNSSLYLIFNLLVKFIYKKSDLILCQSLEYKKKISNYSEKIKKKLLFFPSWPEKLPSVDSNNFQEKSNFQFDKNYFNIVFAGNIGESQNFEFLLKVVESNNDKNIRWHIIGEGRNYLNIRNKAKDLNLQNINFYGLKKFKDIQYFLKNADSLLISLKFEKTFLSTIPGKFQTYLLYKKKILGFLGGETASIINKYNIGLALKNYELSEANIILEKLMSKNFEFKKKNFDLLLKIYSKERLIKKIDFFIKKITIKKYINIKLINSINSVNQNENFVISGLNLAFLGFFSSKQIIISDNLYLWPDGYFKKKFFDKKIRKKPGRDLIKEFILDKNIFKRVVVLGNLDESGLNYLKDKFINLEIKHVSLPYGEIRDFVDFIPIFNKTDLIITTLPTPKQEILANYISLTQENYKIICLGGAINMLSGTEKPVPKLIENLAFGEALWRLQFDSKRRFVRLFLSLFNYIKGELRNDYKNFKLHEIS